MKKTLCILIALIALMWLAGCANGPEIPEFTAAQTGPAETTQPAEETGPTLPPEEQVEQTIEALMASPDAPDPEQIQSALDELYQQGCLDEPAVYSEEEQLFTFVYDNGVQGGVSLKDMDDETDGALRNSRMSNSPILSASTGNPLDVLILNGFEDTPFRTEFYNGLYSDWVGLGLDVTLDNDVTVSDLASLQAQDVIIVSMHGGTYNAEPIWSLREEVNADHDAKYAQYLREDHSVAKVYCRDGAWHYWVMSGFFSDNYRAGAFDNTVFYVQCCCFFGCRCYTGTPDTGFADTLLDLSAQTVFGYYNSVASEYGRNVMRATLEAMFEGTTASEALRSATERYGENDAWEDPADDKYFAWPELAGNADAVLVQQPSALGDGTYSVTLSEDSFYQKGGRLWAQVEMTGYVILSADQEASLAPGSVIALSQFGLEDIVISKIVRYRQGNYAELNDAQYLLQQYYDTDQWILTYPENDLPVTYVAGVEQLPIASYAEFTDDTMLMRESLASPLDFFRGNYRDSSWPCAMTVKGGEVTGINFEYRP